MNRETRTFIWGLVLIFACAPGLAIHLHKVIHLTFQGGWQYLLLLSCLYGVIQGCVYIYKSIV